MCFVSGTRKGNHKIGKNLMDTPTNSNANNNSQWNSMGSAFRETLRESQKRRVVIRKSSGKKIFECSMLLALILSVGAPVLPAFVVLGVLVESISVSFERI
jgi:enoyl-CoA hydratase/carnithine racemase